MLGAVRRGFASSTRTCLRASAVQVRAPKCSIPRKYFQDSSNPIKPLSRHIHTSTLLRQYAASGDAEAEAIEEDIHRQTNAPSPSTDLPVTRFTELEERGLVCSTVVQTLTSRLGLETMTEVQSKTINETLKGVDVLAQAKTGTGKTLAFLIPLLQNIISVDPALERRSEKFNASAADIRAIIISPTRELAEQIAVEAKKLVQGTGVVVQTAVGGSQKGYHLDLMRRYGCHILVGTPGRINDIFSDDRSGVRAPNLSAFVLDEADRLLDQGFAPAIEEIQTLLPDRRKVDRQTLLFSATVPDAVMGIVRETMKPSFKFVRTVQKGEAQTHETVPQKQVVVRSYENIMPAIMELCKREIARTDTRPFKAIIYFGATAEVTLAMSTLLQMKSRGSSAFHQHPLHPAKVYEIHSKLTQAQRTRSADNFRRATSGILLSSDVTARGMDFPDVTHVIQIGLPQTKETYIHRLGRTARAGKEGEGWLFLNPFEARDARQMLDGIRIQPDETLETAKVDMTTDAQLPQHVAETLTQVIDASKMVDIKEKSTAYVATLGYYGWVPNKQKLVDALNARSKYLWAMNHPPGVSPMLINKMGLNKVHGIVPHRRSFDDDDQASGPSGRGFGMGRGGFSGGRDGRPGGDRGSFRGRPSYDRDSNNQSNFGRDRGSFGDRPSYRGRENSGGRGGYGNRGEDRGGYGGSYGGRREPGGGRARTENADY